MVHRIVGTAGHIDHGKTALIRALTGVNTDRLKEEQERGITIELGFAPLNLGDGEVAGVVDVPGHERFVSTMLAGAGGIDTVLLVVAADESVQPQTREHFEICRLLGVTSGVIVLTKIDRADSELESLVREEIAELVRGSFLEAAAVVRVSAQTGEGVEEVRQALARAIWSAPPPPRPNFARLPVDRVFQVHGFGVITTGTLLSGRIVKGDVMTLWPAGEPARVRRIEIHGRAAPSAEAGQRVALNLTSSGRQELRRGVLLASPGRMAASSLLDVRLQLLKSASGGIQHQAPVRLHHGTLEVGARVRLLGRRTTLPAGGWAFAQLRLARPLASTVGDRFILRRPSPPRTLGGGQVIDPLPAKHRPGEMEVTEWLETMETASLEQRILVLLEMSGETGSSVQILSLRTGAGKDEIIGAITHLAAGGALLEKGGLVVGRTALLKVQERMATLLQDYHRRNPLQRGMSLQELRRRAAADPPAALVDAFLEKLVAAGTIRVEGERASAATHEVILAEAEEELLAKVSSTIRQAGLDPPDVKALLRRQGVESARARSLIHVLLQRGELIRVAENYHLHARVLMELKESLWQRRETDPIIDVASFKRLTSTTRRTAIPLLEYLDAEKITTRRGDQRYIQAPHTRGS
ncbi:MAG: selenocysteine-specific translation elongation factor [Acidobacteriota bacterium]